MVKHHLERLNQWFPNGGELPPGGEFGTFQWGNLVLFRGGMAAFVIFYFSAYLCIVYINYVFHVIVFNNLHIHAFKIFECSRNVIVHICSDTFI